MNAGIAMPTSMYHDPSNAAAMVVTSLEYFRNLLIQAKAFLPKLIIDDGLHTPEDYVSLASAHNLRVTVMEFDKFDTAEGLLQSAMQCREQNVVISALAAISLPPRIKG